MRSLSAAQREARQRQGLRISQAIEYAGLTQKELAEHLQERRGASSTKITQGYVAQLVCGQRNVAPALLEQIAEITTVPAEYLSEGVGWTPPQMPSSLLQTPTHSASMPLDADAIAQIRMYGAEVIVPSSDAGKKVLNVLNVELKRKDRLFGDRQVVVVVLEKKG